MQREAVKERADKLGAQILSVSNLDSQNRYSLEKRIPVDEFMDGVRFYQKENVWIDEKTKKTIAVGRNATVVNIIEFTDDKPIKSSFQMMDEGGIAHSGNHSGNPVIDLGKWGEKYEYKALPDTVEIDLIGERKSRVNDMGSLPGSQNNLVGKAQIDKNVINSDDWLKGKTGDKEAAGRIVDSLWSLKKTEKLEEMLGNFANKVLITMPSTSSMNVIPKIFGRKLAKAFEGKIKVIQGDDYFNLTHNKEVKNVSRTERVFFERKFVPEKPLGKEIEGKQAVLVDDIFTTGGSVKAFSQALAAQNLKVDNIVGLMGDKRFKVDQKTADKLEKALSDQKGDIDLEKLSKKLTRTEAGLLIQRLNKEKGSNNDLTKRIQGLYDGTFVRNIEGNRIAGRDNSPGRRNINNAKDVKGIQDRGSLEGYGR